MASIKGHLAFSSVIAMIMFILHIANASVSIATLTLTTPVGCGAFANGHTILSCLSTFTTTRTMVNIYPSTVIPTGTQTRTHVLTVTTTAMIPTTTVTKTISEVAIPSKSATGYCWNGQQDLLTPCTELLLPTATPKTNAAIRVNNPVQHLMSIVKRSRLASNVQRDPCPYNLLILILGVSFLCFEVIAVHLVWGPQLSRRPSLRIAMLSQVIICGLLVGLAYHFRVAGRRC